MEQSVGERFARALLAKDWPAVEAVLAPDVSFLGLTPGQSWEAEGPRQAIDGVFTHWIEPSDDVTEVLEVAEAVVGDRSRVTYRFAVTNPGGDFVCEQTAYYSAPEGRIDFLRVVCSGFREAGAAG